MTVFQLRDGNKQEGEKAHMQTYAQVPTIKHTHTNAGARATNPHEDTQTAYK